MNNNLQLFSRTVKFISAYEANENVHHGKYKKNNTHCLARNLNECITEALTFLTLVTSTEITL